MPLAAGGDFAALPDSDDDDLGGADAAPASRRPGARKPAAKPPGAAPPRSPPIAAPPPGISAELRSAFDLKPSSAAARAREQIEKVLGKKRANLVAAAGSKAGGAPDESAAAALPGPKRSRRMQKLLKDKRTDDARRDRLARADLDLRRSEAEERAKDAEEEVRRQQAGADALSAELRARVARAEETLGEAIDETPCPSEAALGLSDDAFVRPAAPSANETQYGLPPPPPGASDLAPYLAAAERGAARRGDDPRRARFAVLRELLRGGWLVVHYAADPRARADAETAAWLHDVATNRGTVDRECVLGARDALLASAGFEAGAGGEAAAPSLAPSRLVEPAIARPRDARGDDAPSAAAAPRSVPKRPDARGGVPRWNFPARDSLAALSRVGIPLLDDAGTPEEGGGLLAGGDEAALRAASEIRRATPGPVAPRTFAAVQLLGARCAGAFDEDRDENPVEADPPLAAKALAALAAVRLDPRAGAMRASVDFAGAAMLSAASVASPEAYASFAAEAATRVARVGRTHASRLAAVRWLPFASERGQRVQDRAALAALEDLAPRIVNAIEEDRSGEEEEGDKAKNPTRKKPDIKGKRSKPAAKKTEKAASASDAAASALPSAEALRAAAVEALRPVRVTKRASADAAWALATAIRLADLVLHSGLASAPREGESGAAAAAAAAADAASLQRASEGFMAFLKDVKAKITNNHRAALSAVKMLAVALYTRHQRAQQLREAEHDLANRDREGAGDESDGE